MILDRTRCYRAHAAARPWAVPGRDQLLQEGLGGSPWRVAVASMLLCRTRRAQAERALSELLTRWPEPELLARADPVELAEAVRPCGLHRNRARQLARFSCQWLGEWEDLRELTGVGAYVADAVALVCFGCGELSSGDGPLEANRGRLSAL